MTAAVPGYDEILLTAPGARLCNSRGCADAGTLAAVIVTYGVLNDPGAGICARGALWRECWGTSCPMCASCWDSSRQVMMTYRPGLVIIDATAGGFPRRQFLAGLAATSAAGGLLAACGTAAPAAVPAFVDSLDAYSDKISGYAPDRVGQPVSDLDFATLWFVR